MNKEDILKFVMEQGYTEYQAQTIFYEMYMTKYLGEPLEYNYEKILEDCDEWYKNEIDMQNSYS